MADQTLREALDLIVTKADQRAPDRVARVAARVDVEAIRALLAAHPEPALPHLRVQETPADGLRAALEKLCVDLEEYSDSITAVTLRALLAQHPAPHPRPVVDREALEKVMEDHGVGAWTITSSTEMLKHRAQIADAILALLPTEEGAVAKGLAEKIAVALDARAAEWKTPDPVPEDWDSHHLIVRGASETATRYAADLTRKIGRGETDGV